MKELGIAGQPRTLVLPQVVDDALSPRRATLPDRFKLHMCSSLLMPVQIGIVWNARWRRRPEPGDRFVDGAHLPDRKPSARRDGKVAAGKEAISQAPVRKEPLHPSKERVATPRYLAQVRSLEPSTKIQRAAEQ